MQLTKLDGRTLIIKTKPGQVTPSCTFNPFIDSTEYSSWETLNDFDCKLDSVAQTDFVDVDKLKKTVCDGQLKGRGICCFVVHNGHTTFKQGTMSDALTSKVACTGATMYVLNDSNKSKENRMLVAVKGEGMPFVGDPFQFGNLFLQLEVEFPEEISLENQEMLKQLLPVALNSSSADETSHDVDTQFTTMLDPIVSYNHGVFAAKLSAQPQDEAIHNDNEHRVNCAQQ